MELRVNGRRVRATTGGRPLDPDNPLVVFVHGAGMDRTVWSLQTRFFAHHGWTVLAVDLAGHGGSDGPVPASIPEHAEWLADVIAAAGWSRAALVGHSMGSFITLHLAATQPELVTHLALLATAATMPVHRDLLVAAKESDPRAFDLIMSWGFGRPAHLGGHRTPGLWMIGGGTRLMHHIADGVLYTDLVASQSYTAAPEVARAVVCPTLAILGDGDRMTPVEAAEPLVDALPNVTAIVLEGSGHMMMIEQPDPVIDALAAFLAG